MKQFMPGAFLEKVKETDDSKLLEGLGFGYARNFSEGEGNLSLEEFKRYLVFLDGEPGMKRYSCEELLFFAKMAGTMAEILAGNEKDVVSAESVWDRAKRMKGMNKRRIL